MSTLWSLPPTPEFISWDQGTKRIPPPIQFRTSAKNVSREPLSPLPGPPFVPWGLRSPLDGQHPLLTFLLLSALEAAATQN